MREASIRRDVLFRSLIIAAPFFLAGCKRTTLGPDVVPISVPPGNWRELAERIDTFGKSQGLTVNGEIESIPAAKGVQFNYALAQGYSSWRGDDYDIWLVSNPGNPSEMHVNLLLSGKPITDEQLALARSFLVSIRDLKCQRKVGIS